jgi:hypothetical protein
MAADKHDLSVGKLCTFGHGSVAANQITNHPEMTGSTAIHFVPSFFIDSKTFNTFGGVMDGAFNVRLSLYVSLLHWLMRLSVMTAQLWLAHQTHSH